MSLFIGDFQCREDVIKAFTWTEDEFHFGDTPPSDQPPSDDFCIEVAAYVDENYQGRAFVLIKRGNELSEINGSHCSCHGLGGQWKEEPTTIDALKARIAGHGYILGQPDCTYDDKTANAELTIRAWLEAQA